MTNSSTATPANNRLVWIGTLVAILIAGGALALVFLRWCS